MSARGLINIVPCGLLITYTCGKLLVCFTSVFISVLKPGQVIRVTFSPGPTRIGSREKRNRSLDNMKTYKH